MSSFQVDLQQYWAIVERCATFEDFRKRLVASPIDVLREQGIMVPEGTTLADISATVCAKTTDAILDHEIMLRPEELEHSPHPSFTNATNRHRKCGLC